MTVSLKKLQDQVIVITGASSGIGLASAEAAARGGAKLVLAARSQRALEDIVARINGLGGEAVSVPCDVADRRQVENLREAALLRFGRFDTWVNNAGASIYGRLEEVDERDARRLFDINFWGVVYGSLEALPVLRKTGGCLINVGSEVSEAVVPLQGMYSASKHAVKGFTDALRVEVCEIDDAPVSITLIQPTAVDTPFPSHARNYLPNEPKLPTPQIAPEDVAKAILRAATHPTRDKKVGTMAKLSTAAAKIAPALGDTLSARQGERQTTDQPPRHPEGTLFRSGEDSGLAGRTRGVQN